MEKFRQDAFTVYLYYRGIIIINFSKYLLRFDMAVNGGGGVTLQFQRSPLKATTRTLYLPWNRIVVINSIIMTPHGGAGISWNEEDTSAKVG